MHVFHGLISSPADGARKIIITNILVKKKSSLYGFLRFANLAENSIRILAVRLPRFVMRQDVFLRLAVQYIPVVIRSVNGFNPIASSVHYLNPCGSSLRAARDQHRHQACG